MQWRVLGEFQKLARGKYSPVLESGDIFNVRSHLYTLCFLSEKRELNTKCKHCMLATYFSVIQPKLTSPPPLLGGGGGTSPRSSFVLSRRRKIWELLGITFLKFSISMLYCESCKCLHNYIAWNNVAVTDFLDVNWNSKTFKRYILHDIYLCKKGVDPTPVL